MNDELARARAGDVHAFAELVRGHQRSVYSLALRMLCNREAAEDLSQDVFLELHRRLAGIESAGHLAHWLRRVVFIGRSICFVARPTSIADNRKRCPTWQRRWMTIPSYGSNCERYSMSCPRLHAP